MKKLIITIAAFGFLAGCSPQALHDAYQKTRDSYAFCKDAYKEVRGSLITVSEDFQAVEHNVKQDLRYAVKDFNNATSYMGYQLDEFKKAKDLKTWLGDNQATSDVQDN